MAHSYSIAIVGSRTISDYKIVKTVLDKIFNPQNIKQIVSGGAIGVDSLARRYANQNELNLIEFLPEWQKYGKSAGFRRNDDIVYNADCLIAFWDGKSKGTLNSVSTAMKRGIPTLTINTSRVYKNTNIDERYTLKAQFFTSIKK